MPVIDENYAALECKAFLLVIALFIMYRVVLMKLYSVHVSAQAQEQACSIMFVKSIQCSPVHGLDAQT